MEMIMAMMITLCLSKERAVPSSGPCEMIVENTILSGLQ
jgi:hypothetical protein